MTIQEKIEVLEAAKEGKMIAVQFRNDMVGHSLLKEIEIESKFEFGDVMFINEGHNFNFGIFNYHVIKDGDVFSNFSDEPNCETVFESKSMSSVDEFYSSFIYSNVVSKEQFLNAVLSEDPSDNVAIIAARKFIDAGGILLND